jgi:predicted chitinase
MDLDAGTIASACTVPEANVATSWPLILAALQAQGIGSRAVQIAAAATVATETGTFLPTRERLANANRQPDVAKLQARYIPWHGRGFVQITHEENYRLYSNLIGVDLVENAERACEPGPAALILAAYFKRNHIDQAAEAGDWRKVRRLVNGGYNGWERFNACIAALSS